MEQCILPLEKRGFTGWFPLLENLCVPASLRENIFLPLWQRGTEGDLPLQCGEVTPRVLLKRE